jgi:hypothetical protein
MEGRGDRNASPAAPFAVALPQFLLSFTVTAGLRTGQANAEPNGGRTSSHRPSLNDQQPTRGLPEGADVVCYGTGIPRLLTGSIVDDDALA